MTQCPTCHAENSSDSVFCKVCSSSLIFDPLSTEKISRRQAAEPGRVEGKREEGAGDWIATDQRASNKTTQILDLHDEFSPRPPGTVIGRRFRINRLLESDQRCNIYQVE